MGVGRRRGGIRRVRRQDGPRPWLTESEIDQHREKLDGRSAICRGGRESLKKLAEVLEHLRGKRRWHKSPAVRGPRLDRRCSTVDTVAETIGENEPAHHRDAEALKKAEVIANLRVPARGRLTASPSRWTQAKVPPVVTPGIVDTCEHVEIPWTCSSPDCLDRRRLPVDASLLEPDVNGGARARARLRGFTRHRRPDRAAFMTAQSRRP